MAEPEKNPAEQAAQETWERLRDCLDQGKSFLLEAGAGAGKTYSLIQALRYLIGKDGAKLVRNHQKIGCITFTNVATNEIETRTDRHPAIYSSTIHAFCWTLLKDFQPLLRREIAGLPSWAERLQESGPIGCQAVEYSLGYPKVEPHTVSLGHNDILVLATKLLESAKFRRILASRFPVVFIDEYQDTDKGFVDGLKTHVLDTDEGPMIGFFGDYWQKIYDSVCGKIEHPKLTFIGKEANFRSAPAIVNCLNRMRSQLPQHVKDPHAGGSVSVFHTNSWLGTRRKGGHWGDDLPAEVAHSYRQELVAKLEADGWVFSPGTSKILMLTHNILAAEQGYQELAGVFPHKEAFIKKEDPHIAFLVDTIEPVCSAFERKQFGEMFAHLGSRIPAVRSHADKDAWFKHMDALVKMRPTVTIGEVMDHLRHAKRIPLPDAAERKEHELEQRREPLTADEPDSVERLRSLRGVPYRQLSALAQFIEDQTPFSTKHGVKGAEFENVLVVFGRGWNWYNFNQFLELAGSGAVPPGKMESYERNRNLFYVVCSRPKKRLALLFTQKLSANALSTLAKWFGSEAIQPLPSR